MSAVLRAVKSTETSPIDFQGGLRRIAYTMECGHVVFAMSKRLSMRPRVCHECTEAAK